MTCIQGLNTFLCVCGFLATTALAKIDNPTSNNQNTLLHRNFDALFALNSEGAGAIDVNPKEPDSRGSETTSMIPHGMNYFNLVALEQMLRLKLSQAMKRPLPFLGTESTVQNKDPDAKSEFGERYHSWIRSRRSPGDDDDVGQEVKKSAARVGSAVLNKARNSVRDGFSSVGRWIMG